MPFKTEKTLPLRARLHLFTKFGWQSTLPLTADEVRGRQADVVELLTIDGAQEDPDMVECFYRCIPANSHMRLLCDQQGPLAVVPDASGLLAFARAEDVEMHIKKDTPMTAIDGGTKLSLEG